MSDHVPQQDQNVVESDHAAQPRAAGTVPQPFSTLLASKPPKTRSAGATVFSAVVHGAVRDTDAVRELGFPVWSTHISVEQPDKRGPAAVNVPIVVDGVLVEPGDIIAADADGVVVIPQSLLAKVIEGAEARAANEVKIRARIAAGELPLDILGLQAVIENAGIEQIKGTWKDEV